MKPRALLVLALWGCGGAALAAPSRPDVQGLLAGVPLHFERNDGQVDSRVRFLARGSGYGLYLTADEAVLSLARSSSSPPDEVRWRLMGGNPAPAVVGEDPLPGKANHLVGDRSRWRTDVPLFGRVRYADVYPGVSLTYYGDQRRLEYDLELAPGADPRQIRFRIDGARSMRLDDEGRLRIRTRTGELVQHAPVVYQVKNGVREPVAARFRRFGKREIGFTVASYDRSRPLVIDPKIDFSTYLGGSLGDEAADVALAPNIDVYVVGTTSSLDFRPPLQMPNPGGRVRAGNDIFVVKLRFDGSTLSVVYATYMGGNGNDVGVGIALESDGKAVVVAQTNSSDIYQTSTHGVRGGNDVWVARLNSAGNGIEYAALLGGDESDEPTGIAVTGARDAYIVGRTQSGNFPTTPASNPPPIGTTLKGPQDAFFTILVADGLSMSYSTYMGGGFSDEANGIAIRSVSGDVYIVGTTDSADFPTKNPLQATIGGGASGVNDASLMIFQPSGTSMDLGFSTFFGGKLADAGLGVAVDSSGVYFTGSSASVDTFPLQNPYQATYGGGPSDAFVTKLRSNGSAIVYSTFLGGSDADVGTDVDVDALTYAYVTGTTSSPSFPVWRPLDPPLDKLQPPSDAFLAKLTPNGCTLDYSTFFGGKADDSAAAVAVTPGGSAVIVGRTNSTLDFPQVLNLTAGYQGGVSDAFATLINDGEPAADLEVRKTASPDPAVAGGALTYTVTVKNLSTTRPAYDVVLQDTLPPVGKVTFVSSSPGTPVCNFASQVLSCNFSCVLPEEEITVTIDVTVNILAFPSIFNQAQIIVPEDPNFSNNQIAITTAVINPADIQVVKDGPPLRNVGQNIDYNVTVTNVGPAQATVITMKDTLPPGTTFVQVTPPCPAPVGGVLTCPIAPLAQGSSVTFTVTVLATSAGIVTNHASASANEPDIVPGNNSASAQTSVVVPTSSVQFFTVRSSSNENVLEWQNPVGAYAGVAIHRTVAAGDCVFETTATNLATRIAFQAPFVSGGHESFVDSSLPNGVTQCYSLFVDFGASAFSAPRFNRGRPFDSTGKVRWEFNIGTSSLASIGNGIGIVHSVANDANLYAMVKGVALAGGLGGGTWPIGYLPYPIVGPSQGRPGSVPLFPGPPNRGTFLSSADGRVYALDSDHGSGAPAIWISPVLGGGVPGLVAPPSGSFTQFGATRNLIYVGSREAGGSRLFGLRLADGQPAAPEGWAVNGATFGLGLIGPVSGQAAVDYATHRVYFASRPFGGAPDNRTVWCVDFETGLVVWAQPHGAIDASVSLRGGHLYVATNDGRVLALRTSDGGADWTFNIPAGEGVAKGYVVTNFLNTNLYFSTATRVWSLRDDGLGFFVNWPSGVTLPGAPGNSPSTPVYAPGALHVWVGGSDNRLHRLNVTDGSPFDSFFLGDPAIPTAVGSPTLDLSGGFVYVGTEAGRVYAIQP